MLTTTMLNEYLAEIRGHVCAHCVERLDGCPPCEPLGKMCGVEQHLPELIDAIHSVQSASIAPYREASQRQICDQCSFRHSAGCPCPMDYLHVLLVQAVEAVDARRQSNALGRQRLAGLSAAAPSEELRTIRRLFDECAGAWTGCDWPTRIGKSGLDLNGWTAADARKKTIATMGHEDEADWQAAALWLTKVEQIARDAEERAALAVRQAAAGDWHDALEHARAALASEFSTGRAVRRGRPITWHRLFLAIEAVARRQPADNAPADMVPQ